MSFLCLDLLIHGATLTGIAMCCGTTLVSKFTRTREPEPRADVDGAAGPQLLVVHPFNGRGTCFVAGNGCQQAGCHSGRRQPMQKRRAVPDQVALPCGVVQTGPNLSGDIDWRGRKIVPASASGHGPAGFAGMRLAVYEPSCRAVPGIHPRAAS